MIIYKQDVLKLLKSKGYNQTRLQRERLLTSKTLDALRHNEYISLKSLDTICKLCRCDVSDIIQYEQDEFLNDYSAE